MNHWIDANGIPLALGDTVTQHSGVIQAVVLELRAHENKQTVIVSSNDEMSNHAVFEFEPHELVRIAAAPSAKYKDDPEYNIGINVICVHCGEQQPELYIRQAQLINWRNGKHIQSAFPHLNADERELLQTGLCSTCWDKLMGGDDA